MEEKRLYLTKLQLREELKRCLNCRTQPCMNACPVNCNPREFIRHALEGDWQEAVSTITRTNPMGQTCGLICPDKFCMKACTRGSIDFPVNIPRVQATILDKYRGEAEALSDEAAPEHRVGVIGAGPAGMAAAGVLSQNGVGVTLFEARDDVGGALNMIPEVRLPRSVIEHDWQHIARSRLVELRTGVRVSKPASLLSEGFDAVIVATGEPNCRRLGVPGEELCTPYMEYLYHPERYRTAGHVAVVGGGNVAADCALTAVRQGAAGVEMFIRRKISDMRISRAEFLALLDAGVNMNGMTSPLLFRQCENDHLAITVRRNYLLDGKWVPLDGSDVSLPYFDLIITAIGSSADKAEASDPRVIYAGDCKTGGSTIVEAISSGRTAAQTILQLFE